MAEGLTSAEVDASVEGRQHSSCPNCGSPRIARYCPDCGQAAPRSSDYSLGAYFSDLLSQVTDADGKTARTFWALATRPGALTVDHLTGRRARYLRPLQLFLLINVLLFIAAPRVPLFSYSLEKYLRYSPPSPVLVATLVERATPNGHTHEPGKGGAEFEAYAKAFDARVEVQRKTLVILFAPALALLLRAMFARRGVKPGIPRRYGEHLVFVLHALAFMWLVLAAWGLIGSLAREVLNLFAGGGLVLLVAVVCILLTLPVYLARAVRRVYRTSWPWAIMVTGIVAASFVALLLAYRGLLFFTTYYSL